jgi:hypothetical protein
MMLVSQVHFKAVRAPRPVLKAQVQFLETLMRYDFHLAACTNRNNAFHSSFTF